MHVDLLVWKQMRAGNDQSYDQEIPIAQARITQAAGRRLVKTQAPQCGSPACRAAPAPGRGTFRLRPIQHPDDRPRPSQQSSADRVSGIHRIPDGAIRVHARAAGRPVRAQSLGGTAWRRAVRTRGMAHSVQRSEHSSRVGLATSGRTEQAGSDPSWRPVK